MTRNQKLMRRINILLENKSNKFKRKYFLLSALAKTKINENKHLYSEAECYANVLVESNGEKPSEEFLIRLNEEALRFSGKKNIQREINFIKNYNDMLNAESRFLKESIIDEELSSISNNNYKLNEKLLNTLLESIQKKTLLLMESDEKETDVESFEELEKIIDSQEQGINDLEEEDLEDEDIYDTFDPEEIKDKQSLKSDPKKISLKKLGYVGDRYEPGVKKARLTALEKVGRDAVNSLKGLSVKAKRKFDIIRQIHFYLNVQQKLNLAKITMQGKADLTQSKERFSSRPSGLTDDEVNNIRSLLDNMLKRHQNYEDLNLDDDTIKEGELLRILFKAAGDKSEDARDYLEHLNRHMPLSTQEREPLPQDPDFAKDFGAMDQEKYDEDQLAKIEAGIDPVTGQPLYEPDTGEVARMSREQFAKREEERKAKLPPQQVVRAEDALSSLEQTFGPMKKIKEILDDVSPEITKMLDNKEFTLADLKDELENISSTIDPDVVDELEELVDALEGGTGINIKILPPESKSDIRSKLYDISSTPEDFAYFVSKFVDTDGPLKLRDLGALMSHGEQGVASDANTVRQGLTKGWFRALFFSFDDSQKASVYATLADLFFNSVETLDLFKDDIIKIQGQKDLSGSGAAKYFDFVKNTMTKESNIRKFLKDEFDQKSDLDSDEYTKEEQKNDIIDVMLTGNTAFRIFATSLMKDYYNNNVWNKCESELTYAIKEYFEKHYPSAEIAKDLPPKPDAKDKKPGKKQKMFKSRDVKKEQGKDIFNPIIYAAMGRTGIKDSKGTLIQPDQMVDQRKQEFRKGKTLAKIKDFSANYKAIPSKHGTGIFDARDLEDLMDDIFNPKGIIGGTFAKFQKMDKEEFKNFIAWADNLKENDVMQCVAQAYTLSSASSVLDPDEFMRPSKIDLSTKEAVGRLKEYMKVYKDKIAEQRKNLKIEDAEFVIYKGQKCEVDDIDMSRKMIHIYLPDDTLVKVPVAEVSLLS